MNRIFLALMLITVCGAVIAQTSNKQVKPDAPNQQRTRTSSTTNTHGHIWPWRKTRQHLEQFNLQNLAS
jgi:hypothetical protein